MRISDWSSDVCSSDLDEIRAVLDEGDLDGVAWRVEAVRDVEGDSCAFLFADDEQLTGSCDATPQDASFGESTVVFGLALGTSTEEVHVELSDGSVVDIETMPADGVDRSEEHTSELQSLMRISYAV